MKCRESIIQSPLDTDFYKFSMGQWVWKNFPDVPVTYGFINRTKGIPLAKLIKEGDLRRELDHIRTLKFTNSELHYIGGTFEYGKRMFCEEYVQFLKNLTLPEYNLEKIGDTYRLEFPGPWSKAIYWETPALSVITELYNRPTLEKMSNFEKDVFYARAKIRLAEKIEIIRRYPEITSSDFGSRRRFSYEWQDWLDMVLAEELPKQFLGTSNTYFAYKYGLMPMGTSAHELFMIMTAIMSGDKKSIASSQNEVYRLWWDLYGSGLSIALPDTFGSDFFFKTAPLEMAENWKGVRQDSGDPFLFGESLINWYKSNGVDPKTKLLVFSDGLTVETIVELHLKFRNRIKDTYGWGTNLTNDMPGIRPLSLIIKPVAACGRGLVKLSDNIAKAIGKPADIEQFKKIFGYMNDFNRACVY